MTDQSSECDYYEEAKMNERESGRKSVIETQGTAKCDSEECTYSRKPIRYKLSARTIIQILRLIYRSFVVAVSSQTL